jgi:hypothetical protein
METIVETAKGRTQYSNTEEKKIGALLSPPTVKRNLYQHPLLQRMMAVSLIL